MSDNSSVDSGNAGTADPMTIVVDDIDVEDLHLRALKNASSTYIDPPTGFTVFTDLIHLKRGNCCGNKCRHCPYGFESVPGVPRRPAKLRSGDRQAADSLIQAIQNGTPVMEATLPPLTDIELEAKYKNSNIVKPKRRGYVRRKDRQAISPNKLATLPSSSASSSASSSFSTKATTSKNVPYTRKGDGGSSMLGTGERRPKDDANFEAMGTVDELCSVVGVVDAHLSKDIDYGNLSSLLQSVMSRLFDIGSHIAKPSKEYQANGLGDGFDPKHTEDLEEWINIMTEELPELTSFILPTGAKAAAHLHVARTVCRRAERRVLPLVRDDQTCDPHALKYLNRLSDFFFVAARWVNYCHGEPETQYQRHAPGMTQREVVSRSLQQQDSGEER
ncbi:unnamed protein product [Cylindrotheca closterium]|uniref:Corrinoid adenosyltransferase MMAB n=1 Tax=Cylindrotheca closterium TaxID=2856 RepID=A0AAD2PX11_9STRA|nr:unnamed protein product [Cylindrotheca closterium]